MIRIRKYSAEVLGKTVEALIADTGAGLSVTVSGGDRGHIGAVAAKAPGEDLLSRQFPSHREGIVADKWARVLSDHFGETVSVSCGVHYDNAAKEQIEEILRGLDSLLDEVLDSGLCGSSAEGNL